MKPVAKRKQTQSRRRNSNDENLLPGDCVLHGQYAPSIMYPEETIATFPGSWEMTTDKRLRNGPFVDGRG